MSAQTVPRRSAASSAEATARFAVVAVVVASVPLSIVVTGPLQAAGLLWPLYGVLLAWALVTAARTRGWRDAPLLLLLAFWAVFAAWVPYALHAAPNPVLGQREVDAMAAGGVVTGIVAGLARGRRGALVAVRVGWIAALVATGAIACWEIVTHHHMWEAQRPWPFPKHTMVAATLYNPNNYGTALLAMIAAALAARTASRRPWLRWLCALLALAGVGLVVLTESRAALLGVLLLAALHALAWVCGRVGGARALWRAAWGGHRGLVVAGAAVLAGGLVAAFAVPPLARHNPIYLAIRDSMGAETAKSDHVRIDLMRRALHYLAGTHGLGTGAGSFEPLLQADPHAGVPRNLNLHDSFVEILSQYGVAVALPLFALVVLLAVVCARAVLRRPARPDAGVGAQMVSERRAVGVEGAGYLLAFVMFGVTVSSALPLQTWWLTLASTVAAASWLRSADAEEGREGGGGATSVVDVGHESRPR